MWTDPFDRWLGEPVFVQVPWGEARRAIEDSLLNHVPIYFGTPSPEMVEALNERYGQGNWRTVLSYFVRKQEPRGFIDPSWVNTPAFHGYVAR